jgi:hypothetical protein
MARGIMEENNMMFAIGGLKPSCITTVCLSVNQVKQVQA